MKITNTQVYGLDETIKASGFPKLTSIDMGQNVVKGDLKGIKTLAQAKTGSGHDCALKGIIVQYTVEAPQYWWLQFGRYHFADIISSQSKMHRLLTMDLDEQCNEYVMEQTIKELKRLIDIYNNFDAYKEQYSVLHLRSKTVEFTQENLFKYILSNTPMGLNLLARVTDNYLSLKTQYFQRRNHKLDEWSKDWVDWVEGLPMFKELILGDVQ